MLASNDKQEIRFDLNDPIFTLKTTVKMSKKMEVKCQSCKIKDLGIKDPNNCEFCG